MTQEQEDQINLLLHTSLYEEKLNEWEVNFLDDIADLETLSANQCKKLDEVWDRVVEGK